MRIAVVTGNPKPAFRTHGVALAVARALAAALSRLTGEVAAADVAIFASPTYKAAYTGMLEAFLDRYVGNGLARTIAVPGAGAPRRRASARPSLRS